MLLVVCCSLSVLGYTIHLPSFAHPRFTARICCSSFAVQWREADVKGVVPGRSRHAACVTAKAMFVHCGTGDDTLLYDWRVLDLATLTWRVPRLKGDLPDARSSHTLTQVDPRTLILFGGRVGEEVRNDLYSLDIGTLTITELEPGGVAPPPLYNHSAECIGKCVVVAGGTMSDGKPNEKVYSYDTEAKSWSQLNTKGKLYCRGEQVRQA